MSALPKPIVPFSIIAWLSTAKDILEFKDFVFEPATERLIVPKILTLCPAKSVPKFNVKVLPVGEPAKVNIVCAKWLLPVKLNTSPTEPVLPPPVVIIETEKSDSAKPANVSFVPAVIEASPLPDNVAVKCLLIAKFVSVIPEFKVVFNVLIVS